MPSIGLVWITCCKDFNTLCIHYSRGNLIELRRVYARADNFCSRILDNPLRLCYHMSSSLNPFSFPSLSKTKITYFFVTMAVDTN